MEISATSEKIVLFYGTSGRLTFSPDTIDDKTYTLAIKEVRNPSAP